MESDSQFYNEYCHLQNVTEEILATTQKQKMQLLSLKNNLKELVDKAKVDEERIGWNFDFGNEKKKRIRRKAKQVDRCYKCKAEDCAKVYGTEGSLKQHIKIKHQEWPIRC